MTISNVEPKITSPDDVAKVLKKLKKVDESSMLERLLQMPEQILLGVEASRSFEAGDIPLDRSRVYLLGLGGSAIAGKLINDMLSPRQPVSVFGGYPPPRDKRGVIVSSYSGNTIEVLELAERVTGGLRTVVFLTSGGEMMELATEQSIPVWRIPEGYQPRAAVGWSMSLALAVMEKWNVVTNAQNKLVKAAKRLKASLEQDDIKGHVLARAALPIAQEIKGKHTVILHSHNCTGAARRLAAQINENGKQPACTQMVPEAMHNAVQGIAGADPKDWALIFMSDANGDTASLRASMHRTLQYFVDLGFACLPYPAAGDDEFELTLSCLLLADLTSLLLAGLKNVDPTPINVISGLKETETAPEEEQQQVSEEEDLDTEEKTSEDQQE